MYYNGKIKTTASAIGILLGLSGSINHGLFEILQGFKPTNGFFIEAIGESHRFWIHGTEAAFTVIHNYLITGIFAILTGLAIVVWSLNYLDKKPGSTVFLFLFIVLTLVGGGIGYIVLFLPTWAFATRINKPLIWWKRSLSQHARRVLSALWIYSLVTTIICWLMVMQMGIFGYFPGQNNPDTVLNVVFLFLFSSFVSAFATFVCALAKDTEEQRVNNILNRTNQSHIIATT